MINFLCELDWKLITTISIALIAGFIALFQVRKNVISAARTKWIEDLREVVSKYITELNSVLVLYDNMKFYSKKLIEKKIAPNENDNFISTKYNPYLQNTKIVEQLHLKIILYLNPHDNNHKSVINNLVEINGILSDVMTAKNSVLLKDLNNMVQPHIEFIIEMMQKIFVLEHSKSKRLF